MSNGRSSAICENNVAIADFSPSSATMEEFLLVKFLGYTSLKI